MKEFVTGQTLKASDLNELASIKRNNVILSTKDQKLINTENGQLYQDFFTSHPQDIITTKPLDIKLQYDSDGNAYVWMYINNVNHSSVGNNGYTFCKYNGEYIRAIVGIGPSVGDKLNKSILFPGLSLKGYEPNVHRGANGFGWWWTGLKLPTDSQSDYGSYDIVGRIAQVHTDVYDIFQILVVTFRYLSSRIKRELFEGDQIPIFLNSNAFEATIDGVHNIGEPITIAQVQNDEQIYGSGDNQISVSNKWQYAQVTNNIDYNVGYEPWEIVPYYSGGIANVLSNDTPISFWRPVYYIDGKQHTIEDKLNLSTDYVLDDIKIEGLAFYAVHNLENDEVTLSTQTWMYEGDEQTEQQLPEKLSAFNDEEKEGQLICWMNTFGTQYFTRTPYFNSSISSSIYVDSEISALGLSSLQKLNDISSLSPDISADPKLSSAQDCYEIYKFDDLEYKSDVTKLLYESDPTSCQVLLRTTDDAESESGENNTKVQYVDLSSVLFNPDAQCKSQNNTTSSLTSEIDTTISAYVARIYGWSSSDSNYQPKTIEEIKTEGVEKYNVLLRHTHADNTTNDNEFVSLESLLSGGGDSWPGDADLAYKSRSIQTNNNPDDGPEKYYSLYKWNDRSYYMLSSTLVQNASFIDVCLRDKRNQSSTQLQYIEASTFLQAALSGYSGTFTVATGRQRCSSESGWNIQSEKLSVTFESGVLKEVSDPVWDTGLPTTPLSEEV